MLPPCSFKSRESYAGKKVWQLKQQLQHAARLVHAHLLAAGVESGPGLPQGGLDARLEGKVPRDVADGDGVWCEGEGTGKF
jgi:hypothetical protein